VEIGFVVEGARVAKISGSVKLGGEVNSTAVGECGRVLWWRGECLFLVEGQTKFGMDRFGRVFGCDLLGFYVQGSAREIRIGIRLFVRDVSCDIDLFAGGVAKDGGIRVIGWTNLNVECAEEYEGDKGEDAGNPNARASQVEGSGNECDETEHPPCGWSPEASPEGDSRGERGESMKHWRARVADALEGCGGEEWGHGFCCGARLKAVCGCVHR